MLLGVGGREEARAEEDVVEDVVVALACRRGASGRAGEEEQNTS